MTLKYKHLVLSRKVLVLVFLTPANTLRTCWKCNHPRRWI
ncbi:hypothetical protein FOIG_16793 [Fusarium odoratissimum NRRL 54006]|uniref:Uncharacterized protein n=1 Tax=Fusarium odoratissimum (strain NRRL 54006) TaxID=1089451 RepID=X0JYI9_FUSO5|nr:uncharacterized protein FOIG_16793 [Fusarium odoratissimum NRRL 54006]EXL89924.1 hypothetical protein FOIG_16793 [Fusarium odoratissimum NRRL 54006]